MNFLKLIQIQQIQLQLKNKLKENRQKYIMIHKKKINYEINQIIYLLIKFIFFIYIKPVLTQITFNKIRNLNYIQIINLKIISYEYTDKEKIINPYYIPDNIYINGQNSDIDNEGYAEIEMGETNNITLEWNEKMTNYDEMFKDVYGIIEINLTNFNTSGVTSMGGMFLNCLSLLNIDLSNINTSSVYNMTSMFEGCISLTSLDLSNFDTSQVSNIDRIFKNCFSLTSLNLSNFRTPNLINMEEMFYDCNKLETLDISNINTSQVNSMHSVFSFCEVLISLDISHFNTENVENMESMFNHCSSLTSIDLSNFITTKVTNMKSMFYRCISLTSIDISNFDISNVENMEEMFSYCESILSFDFSNFDLSYKYLDSFIEGCSSLTSIKFSNKNNLLYSISLMFCYCNSLKVIDLSNLNFHLVTDMSYLFYGCESLKSLDLSYIKTNSLTDIHSMFYGCTSLEKINFKNFNTSLVTDMSYLFYYCSSLTSLDLSDFNTSSVEDMSYLFAYCYNLKELNLTSFDISFVTTMNSMFKKCISLISLDLSSFNIHAKLDLNEMFKDCSNLKYINFYNLKEHDSNAFEMLIGTHKDLVICVNELIAEYLIKGISSEQCVIKNCSIKIDPKQKKRIKVNSICLNDCQIDPIYKYDFENYCYEKCPKGTHSLKDNIYKCDLNKYECIDDYPFLIFRDSSCTEECNCKDFFNNICTIYNKNITHSQSILITNIIKGIQDGLIDDIILEILNGKDIIKTELDTSYQITTTFNQINNKYTNISVINLCECENILKEKYNILENETLIIFKTEKKIKGLLIPLIEYEIFNLKTKEKLDLNYCKIKDINISITIPISINENILFQYDYNDIYYNDICYIYNLETLTDITIYDRQREFNNNSLCLCPKNCIIDRYNPENKTINCYCKIQDRLFYSDINKDEMIFKFVINKRKTNFHILKCYKLLFSKKGLINNIGSYIILLVIILYIISGIYFYRKEYNLFCEYINDILNFKNIENNNYNNSKIILKEDIKENITDIVSSSRKKENNNNKKHNMNISKISSDYSDIKSSSFRNIFNNNGKKINKEIIEKNKKYIEHEMNFFPYDKALEKDKRTFFQLYLSLLKERHILLSSFSLNKDYNPFTIKLCLLFFSIVLNIILNALFFNDSLMNRIYIDKGIYKISHNIPNIIYSLLIFYVIITIAKRLFLTQKNLLDIKYEKNKNKVRGLAIIVIKYIIIKSACFFIFGILFLFLFWYYLSSFCAVYKKTQIYLIKNSLISYSIVLIYPFVICLLPGIFRIPALKEPGEYLYKINQFMQLI